MVGAFCVAPLVAAARVSPWFLLALLPAVVLATGFVRERRLGDPRDRLARFDTAAAAGSGR